MNISSVLVYWVGELSPGQFRRSNAEVDEIIKSRFGANIKAQILLVISLV